MTQMIYKHGEEAQSGTHGGGDSTVLIACQLTISLGENHRKL